MHEDGSSFHKLWMTTAGNLSVEIRYEKLKVNFNYCLRHGIFQNQVYIFLYYFLGPFVLQFYRKICLLFFSEFLVIRMFVKNSIFALQILEKQLHVFAWSTLHKSRQTLSYMWKYTWEKDIAESKGHNPVKKCTFYQYHQRFTVLYPPKICVKCFFLRNTASKRNIKHHISLKTYENWCPYDNHLYSTCERITKLNKEALGKIKNTSKNDWRGCPSPLKFDQ